MVHGGPYFWIMLQEEGKKRRRKSKNSPAFTLAKYPIVMAAETGIYEGLEASHSDTEGVHRHVSKADTKPSGLDAVT